MDLDRARDDLLVAGTAAGCAIALTLGFEFGLATSLPLGYRLTPLLVYVAYAITRKGGPYWRYDTPNAWSLLTLVVAVGTALVAL